MASIIKGMKWLNLREFNGVGSRDTFAAGLREVPNQDVQSLLSGERRDPFRRLIQLFRYMESPSQGEFLHLPHKSGVRIRVLSELPKIRHNEFPLSI